MLVQFDRVGRLLKRRSAGKPYVRRGSMRVLSIIKRHESISTRELALIMDIRPASLNESLAQLEQEERIQRVRDPRDQRSYLVELLPRGNELLEKMKEARRAFAAKSADILSAEEMNSLTYLLEKLADGLDQLATESKEAPDG